MKKHLLTLLLLPFALGAAAQNTEIADTAAQTLSEVVVQGASQIETASKTILFPTKLEKQHSTNGYQLLANMNLPDIAVDAQGQTIQTIAGQNVIVLINGIEAQPDELATLSASQIISIDYQRNPGGKYAGKGAVMNFLTKQYEYGGNVYISAEEGLARQYGKYIAMANYKRRAVNLSVTTSANWSHTSMRNSSDNTFLLSDGTLRQVVEPIENKTRSNSEYARLKFEHIDNNHALELSTLITRSATPLRQFSDNVSYSGVYNFNSIAERSSKERAFSPKFVLDYSLTMPRDQYLWILAFAQFGHTNFNSNYAETGAAPISNNTIENSFECEGGIYYQKGFSHGITASINLNDYYTRYRDKYISETADFQTLTNNNWQASATFQQIFDNGLSYFATAGLSGLTTHLGDTHETQISPIAMYNASYALNSKHRFNINGHYLHTVYDPTDKNNASIRTSFFETTLGNPALKPIKVLQNVFSYNGRIGIVGLSATYNMFRYADNCSNCYFVEGNTVYKQKINDGAFLGQRFIVGASLNLLGNKLKILANEVFAIDKFDSEYRPRKATSWRFSANASYMFGDWQVKGIWSPAFKNIDLDGQRIRMSAQYGIILNWKHGNWAAECTVKNFLRRYRSVSEWFDYGPVQRTSRSLSDAIGRNVCLSLTYTLPYGKETDPEDADISSSINSAILRPF